MKLVKVTWEDSAFAPAGWHESDETITPVLCTSVGIVHERTEKGIVLATCIDDGGRVGGLSVIPASAIRKVQKLR